MAKKEEKPAHSLYTDTQPAHIAAIARALTCPKDSFRTGVFIAGDPKADRDDPSYAQYYEAKKIAGTEFWDVTYCNKWHDGEIVLHNTYFFDALHYCAQREAEMQAKGRAPFINSHPHADILPHYSEAADAADVPLDSEDMPHPAAHGIAYANDAIFSGKALAAIQRTENKPLILPPDPTAEEILTRLFNESADIHRKKTLAATKPTSWIEQRRHKKFENKLDDAKALAREMDLVVRIMCGKILEYGESSDVLKTCSSRKTKYAIIGGVTAQTSFIILTSIFFPPLLAANYFAYLGGRAAGKRLHEKRELSALDVFYELDKRLEELTQTLPDVREKSLLTDFNRAARGTVLAAHIHDLQTQTAKAADKDAPHKAGLAFLEKAGPQAGVAARDLAVLKNLFTQGTFPDLRANLVKRLKNKKYELYYQLM